MPEGARVVDIAETGYIQTALDANNNPQIMVGNKNLLKMVDAAWGGRMQFGTVRVTIDLIPQTETSVGLDREGN